MQLKIAKILNQALLIVALLVIAMVAFGFYISRNYPNFRYVYIVICVILCGGLSVFFRYLEANWDKRVITKMALDSKIALVNIKNAGRELPMRDSSLISYWLYRFEGELYPQNGAGKPVTFYEKMSGATKEIPNGSVYVTYDERKPAQIFIIPTDLLARIPALADVAAGYEKREDIKVKYLYAYYNRGMELKNFSDIVSGKGDRQ